MSSSIFCFKSSHEFVLKISKLFSVNSAYFLLLVLDLKRSQPCFNIFVSLFSELELLHFNVLVLSEDEHVISFCFVHDLQDTRMSINIDAAF